MILCCTARAVAECGGGICLSGKGHVEPMLNMRNFGSPDIPVKT